MREGKDVARVHSGDPSLYGAIAEQMRRLDKLGIDYDVTPGVPAFAAAAAALKTEFTLPEIAQTVILTRTTMQASPMPEGEALEELGRSRATLAIHLSIRNLGYIERALTPHYGADCPVVVVYRVTWPDEKIIRGTLSTIAAKVRAAKLTRTALILVGPCSTRMASAIQPSTIRATSTSCAIARPRQGRLSLSDCAGIGRGLGVHNSTMMPS